jgi:hypothetical protein
VRDDLRLADRVERLERKMSLLLRFCAWSGSWFRRRRVNAKSRVLSGPEAIDLRTRMRAHGCADEESDSRWKACDRAQR